MVISFITSSSTLGIDDNYPAASRTTPFGQLQVSAKTESGRKAAFTYVQRASQSIHGHLAAAAGLRPSVVAEQHVPHDWCGHSLTLVHD